MPGTRAKRGGVTFGLVRVLLDECVPWPIRRVLAGHECNTPSRLGWAGIENGDLVRRADERFDIFVTSDQNLRYQQGLTSRRIAIVELWTNNLRKLERNGDEIRRVVDEIQPGEFRRVELG